MPYDWIDPHYGAIPQINREDAAQTDAEKAIAEERTRGLRVPGLRPGMLPHEEGAMRGAAPSDPRGLVFDDKALAPRPYTDEDMAAPKRAARDDDKPAAAERRSAEAKK